MYVFPKTYYKHVARLLQVTTTVLRKCYQSLQQHLSDPNKEEGMIIMEFRYCM